MKKVIIPRRDHEVYFIPLPEKIKAKKIRPYATEQLYRLHPAFSASCALDVSIFSFNNVHYAMATVMEAETFAEYKILNKGAALFTNTSIAAHDNKFLQSGIRVIDDERIGFDTENNSPVSLPPETELKAGQQEFTPRLKAIPPKHGVFVKTISHLYFALAIPAIAVILFTSSVLVFFPKSTVSSQPALIHSEPAPELECLPSAPEILARIASDIADAGGEIQRWQYNEEADPLMIIQLRGLDALNVHNILSQYEFAFLQDIQGVSYIQGRPHLTINVSSVKAGYTVPSALFFPGQSSALSTIVELGKNFQKNKITVISETLPASFNKFYTITYTANDKELIRSFEIISDLCGKYFLRVKKMDVSINGKQNYFTIACSFANSDISTHIETPLNGDRNKIPEAFGFITPPPTAPKVSAATAAVVNNPVIVGSIKEDGARLVFYRDTSGGKIKTREDK